MSTAAPAFENVVRVTSPPRGWRHYTARLVMRIGGWRVSGEGPPDLPKYVVITGPHTSWWDAVWMVANAWYWHIDMSWMVKDTAMKYAPARWFLNWLGALPINRDAPQGLVGQLVQSFKERDELCLVIPPEGTRKLKKYWKSGFYHIALGADVPVVLSLLDYRLKECGFGPCIKLTGNFTEDMDKIRAYYEGATGRFPEQFTPARLKEEDEV